MLHSKYLFLALFVSIAVLALGIGFSRLLPISTISAQTADVTTGLVGHWKFDEGSGTTAADSSGNNNTGTLTNGPTWTAGKINGALSFDGSNDYVALTTQPALGDISAFTITGWYKTTATASGNIYSEGRTTNGNPIQQCYLADGTNLTFFKRNDSGTTGSALDSNSTNDGNWHFGVCVQYSNASREIFVDGVSRGTNTTNVSGLTLNTATIGRLNYGFGQTEYFNGLIDEVRIYNRALTASDIQALYALGSGSPPPDTTPPTLSSGSPTGTLPAGTTSTTLSLFTNENATCRYSTVAGTSYSSMTNAFSTTGGTSHSTLVSGLTNGSSYTYYIRCQDTAGNATTADFAISFSIESTSGDTSAPSTPTNLAATAISSSQINLSWTASTDNVGVTGYRVERCQGSTCTNFSQIATPSGTSYSDTGLSANTTYRYRVRAADAAGNLSGYSSVVSATTQSVSSSNALPPLSSWTELGQVLGAPPSGSWDSFGWGNNKVHALADAPTIDTVIKKNGIYYLYYTGSSQARSDDGYAAYRKIGVATSNDGINFTRYSGNPIMTFSSSNNSINPQEEGAEYAKVTLDANGNFVMYFSACTAASSSEVDCAIHWATSSDGFNFTDNGIVPGLDVSENWPAGLLFAQGKWHLWFNSDRDGSYKVWLATGNAPNNLAIQGPLFARFGAAPTLHPDGRVSVLTQQSGPVTSIWDIYVKDSNINSLDTYSTPYLGTQYGEGLALASIMIDKDSGLYRWYYVHPTQRTFHLRTTTCTGCVPDTTPPSTPTNLTSPSQTSSSISLSWLASSDPESGISSYRIYRCQGSTCTSTTQVGTATGTTFTDTGLTQNTSYRYQVSAVNGAGLESTKSSIVTATTQAALISNLSPAAYVQFTLAGADLMYTDRSFTYLTPLPSTLQNQLAIRTANDNKQSSASSPHMTFTANQSVTVYVLYTNVNTTLESVWLNDANGWTLEPYTVNTTLQGAEAVRSVRKKTFPSGTITLNGNGGTSSATSMYTVVIVPGGTPPPADTTAPSAPTNLSATAISSSQINLSWTASTDNVGVTGYRVERCQGSTCTNFSQIATPTGTTYSDTGLSANTTYRYRVRATDAAGNLSSYSSVVNGTTQQTQSTKFALNDKVQVSGTGGTGLNVRSCASTSCSILGTQAEGNQGTVIGGPTTADGFNWWNINYDAGADGWSAEDFLTKVTTTSDTIAPSVPTNLSATAQSSSQINLSWTASTDNVGVTGYRVERCQGSTCTTFAQIATPSGTSYSDTGLSANTTYRHRVRAADAAGNLSGYSSIVNATTQAPSTNPIDNLQPGHWYIVPNSNLSAVTPNPTPPGYYGPAAVTDAWSGGAYDTKRDRLIIWGGGHGDYAGNEVYVFNINTFQWSRIWGPTPNVPFPGGCDETYSDGNPVSRHTYDGLEYLPNVDRFISNDGSLYQCGWSTRGTWMFDFDNLQWTRRADRPEAAELGPVSAYDSVTGRFLVDGAGSRPLYEYDPQTNTWTRRGASPMGNYQQVGAFDSKRRLLVRIGDGEVNVYDLKQSGLVTPQRVTTTGATAMVNATYIGFEYDPVSDRFVAWHGGADVYLLNPDTWVWTRITPASTNTVIPTAAPHQGTFGRFRYIPSKNAFITFNSIYGNVYVYKLSSGGGTPPPSDTQAPSTPTNLSASTISSSQINLSWTASTDDVGVTGYRVERCAGSTCTNFAQIATPTGTTFNDTGLAANTTYRYRVRAADAAGNLSGYSSVASATTQASAPPPSGTVVVSSISPSTYQTDILNTGSLVYIDRSFTYTTVPASLIGASYIRTANNDKSSTASTFLTFTIDRNATIYVAHDDRITTKPSWMNTFVDSGLNLVTTDTTLSLYQKDFIQGTVILGGNNGITVSSMYTVVAVPSGSTPPPSSTKFQINDRVQVTGTGGTGLNVRSCASTSCSILGSQAEGNQGTVIGGPTTADGFNWWNINYDTAPDGWSAEDFLTKVTTTSDTIAPSVPTNLSATAQSSNQINLSWTASTDNVGVTGYRVERCQGSSCTNFAQIGTPTGTSYSDTSLSANTTYRYRVRAVDAAGNLSGYSSIVGGTTSPPPSGGLDIPLNTWVSRTVPAYPTAPGPVYTKHIRLAFNPDTRLTYFWGGDNCVDNGIDPGRCNSREELYSYDAAQDKWTLVLSQTDANQNGFPTGRCVAGFTWDPKRKVVWMVGGQERYGNYYPGLQSGGLWAFNPATRRWTREGPDPRQGSVNEVNFMAYDPVNDGLFIIDDGRVQVYPLSQVIIGDGVEQNLWTNLSFPVQDPYLVGYNIVHAVDTKRNRAVVYSPYNGEAWAYDLTTRISTRLNQQKLPMYANFTMVYDSVNDLVALWGGGTNFDPNLNDLWIFNPQTNQWTKLAAGGDIPPPTHPQMTFDSVNNAIMLLTGEPQRMYLVRLGNGSTVPDTTPPSVAITAPSAGATVSGTITVSATASDNVSIAGVQFQVDGINIGAEDTTAPYSISWNTTAATNGSHILTAVARDTANNQTTSAPITVTVSNAATLTASLSVSPSSGQAVLSNVNLTASAGGTAGGNINYTFYCNRSDMNTNVTTPYDHKRDGISTNPYTTAGICAFDTPGIYTAKVIVERGGLVAQAQATITVSSPPASTKFQVGDRVRTTANLNVREDPAVSTDLLGTQPSGSLGSIMGGVPIFAEGYWWWYIDYDTGADGWSIENFLELVSSSTPPPTTLLGDLNGDGQINGLDWTIMAGVWFTSDPVADLNKDGIVNSIDFSLMNQNWGKTI